MDFSKADAILSQSIGTITPAAQLVIYHKGAIVHDLAMGFLDPQTTNRAVDSGPLFELASLAKLFTTPVFLKLVEQREVSVDAPVRSVLSEFSVMRPTRPYENPMDWGKTGTVTEQIGAVDADKVTFR